MKKHVNSAIRRLRRSKIIKRLKRKTPHILVALVLLTYIAFVYFSWDILRAVVPDDSEKLIKEFRLGLENYQDKLPPPDMATASPKFMIILVDSLSYNLLELGFKLDILPNLKKIFASSHVGMLLPGEPIETPRIVTSIVTGVPPKLHKILDFVNEEGQYHSGVLREYHAFWQIATERGYRVAVVGWPFTWPARKVNGYYLSAPGIMAMNLEVYKAGYRSFAKSFLYYPTTDEMVDAISLALKEAKAMDASKLAPLSYSKFVKFFLFKLNPLFSLRPKLNHEWLSEAVQRDKFFLEMAKYILKNDQNIDIFATYVESPDVIGHTDFFDPKMVLSVYAWIDSEIGELLKLVKGQPIMLVCGDHGMRLAPRDFSRAYEEIAENRNWPESGVHDPIGALALRVEHPPDEHEILSVGDEAVAPFVLSLFDIPPSAEMKNLELAEWYEGHAIEVGKYSSKRHIPLFVPVYEIIKDPQLFKQYEEWLNSLGYL